MMDMRCGGCRSVDGVGRLALYVPAAFGLALYRTVNRPVSIARGVARKRREQIDSNQECPPRFPAPRERHFAMTITIGIDPHKASHTAVAIDSFEFVLDELRIRSCSTQVTKLRDWADGFRDDRTWAVESAQGLGYLLAQQLIAAGETVLVPAVRASRVRTLSSGRSQKNDPNDARSVAITALRADDLVEVLPDDRRPIGPAPAAHRRNEQQLNSQRSNVEHMSELHRDLAMPPNPRARWAARSGRRPPISCAVPDRVIRRRDPSLRAVSISRRSQRGQTPTSLCLIM